MQLLTPSVAAFSRSVQQAFQHEHLSFAMRIVKSLEDPSLRNITFVDFMQDFSTNAHGECKHCDVLQQLSPKQLHIVRQFLQMIKTSCPACFTLQIGHAFQKINTLLHKQQLLSV